VTSVYETRRPRGRFQQPDFRRALPGARPGSTKEDSMPARKKAAKKKAPVAKRRAAPKMKAASKKAAPKTAPKRAAAPPSPPSAIGAMSQHMDFTTHDLASVKRFYTEMLGFAQFMHDANMNYLYVQTGQSSSVGFMPPMQGMGEPSPAKEPTLYFMVKDVDKAYSALASKGVMFEGPPADMPWGHRVVRTADPEGRTVMLATPKK
jgi:predicted enzyme related to lactoylglutathione lyase